MTLMHSILKHNYFNNCLFFFHSRENKIVVFSNLPIIDSLVKIITSQLQDYISFEDVFCFAREKHAEVLGNLLRKYQPSYCVYFGNKKESGESCDGVSFLFLSFCFNKEAFEWQKFCGYQKYKNVNSFINFVLFKQLVFYLLYAPYIIKR